MKNNLQPKDYAALCFCVGELEQELVATQSFKKMTKQGRFPGYKVEVSIEANLVKISSPSQGASFKTSLEEPVEEGLIEQDNPDIPY